VRPVKNDNQKLQGLKWLAAALFFFLYASGFSAWSSNVSYREAVAVESPAHLLSDHYQSLLQVGHPIYDLCHSPFQAAAETAPSPSESEEKDGEEETKDHTFGKSFGPSHKRVSLHYSAFQSACGLYTEHFVQSRKVSLVILHHCWKSFLS
jgi:hypothetical protein